LSSLHWLWIVATLEEQRTREERDSFKEMLAEEKVMVAAW